jgi:hypothetical protein
MTAYSCRGLQKNLAHSDRSFNISRREAAGKEGRGTVVDVIPFQYRNGGRMGGGRMGNVL